jgi:glucose 1-dehydrogenase
MATQTAISTVKRNRLEGKVAVITGGDEGIGRAITLRLAAEGAAIAFCYHTNRIAAEEVVASITHVGAGTEVERNVLALQADVGNTGEVQNFVSKVFERFGTADILVNNAGLERRADFWDVTEQDYDLVLTVNLKGVFFTSQAVVRHWLAAKQRGKIINISSVHEELPFPHFASYCASKGGLKMLARDLAIELAPYGITINNIAPGAIETPINKRLLNDPAKLKPLLENIPLKRLGIPDDVAGVVSFLASSDADYITGATIFVDGGLLWSYEEQ